MKSILTCFIICISQICFAQQGKTDTTAGKPSINELLEEAMKPHWEFVTVNTENNSYYIRSEKHSSTPSEIKVWVKVTGLTQKKGRKTFKNCHSISLYIIQCNNKRIQVDQVTMYDSKGSVLTSSDSELSEWKEAIPDSAGEAIVNKACEMFAK